MDLYYYRVSKKGASNFPVSLGDKDRGTKNFNIDDIEEFLPQNFQTKILQSINFQIWGIPNTSSASLKTANSMSQGDWIMILGSEDKVNYIGEFLGTFSDNKGLSEHIWGDNTFSQIMFFQGNMVECPWKVPHDLFGYNNYKPDNKLTRVAKNRNPGTMDVIREISEFIVMGSNSEDFVNQNIAHPGYIDRSILLRQGQSEFRNSLLHRHNSQCMLTGCKDQSVLDACHIIPYHLSFDNSLSNGLLLRTDIHTLLDRDLIKFNSEGRISVAKSVQSENYKNLEGRGLRIFDNNLRKEILEKFRH